MSDEEEYYNEGEDNEEEEEEREDKEMLFLIEFLVDTLSVNLMNLNLKNVDPCALTGQTCVVLKFLNFPSMTLCEKDWGSGVDDSSDDKIKFNAGKSLMFALSESQFGNPPPIYLDVSAHKMMPHGSLNPTMPIGMSKICLSELFKQVFDKIEEKPDKLPLSKSIKDTYQLVGSNAKKPTGEVIIYIRLSCLGQNVVTEFQRGGDEFEPFLFKNKESNKVYECKPKDDLEDEDDADVYGRGDTGEKPRKMFGDVPDTDENDQEFDEFGAEVYGHALTIKIQKSQKKAPNGSDVCLCNNDEKPRAVGNQISFDLPKNQSLCQAGGTNRAKVINLKDSNGNAQALEAMPDGEDGGDKDVFVLRIGKKGEVNGKGKLELELRTPKQKVDRGPKGPKKVNKEVQTDKEEGPKKGRKKK